MAAHACTHSSEISNLWWYLSLVNISTQKNQVYLRIPSINTNDQRIMQSVWMRAFWPIFCEAVSFREKKELHGLSFKVTSSNLNTRFSVLFAEVRMNKKSTYHFFPYQDLQNFSKLINRFQEKLVTDGRASINSKNLFWQGAQKEFLHVIFKEFLKF